MLSSFHPISPLPPQSAKLFPGSADTLSLTLKGISPMAMHHIAALALAGLLGFGLQAQACHVPANADAMQQDLLTHLNIQRKAHGLLRFQFQVQRLI